MIIALIATRVIISNYAMRDFKTRFNYLLLGLRALFFLFFVALFLGLIFYAAPKIIRSDDFGIRLFIGLLAALFIAIFLPYRFGKLLLTQRNVLSFKNGDLILTDAILNKRIVISKKEIKGFSLSKYPTKVWDFHELIVYLANGNKIELPQFLYWNFKELRPAFEENGLSFLGYERFRWKFFDSRYYQFD